VSHDGDKLIRQLSLVAYLMAERRPVTARDAKNAVEGYSEMSDEAFARRFYADRAELLALGVGITSQRDEFTGEELYTLTRDDYFLPPLHLDDAELAALQTCLYLLEGQFAYSEPLRLALQNLALGRPNPTRGAPDGAVTLNLTGGGYSPEIAQRLAKLETAISKQRTIVFPYFAMSRAEESTRTVDPYSLYFQGSQWYLVGRDRDREDIRVFRVSRFRGDIRFATRRERDFKFPEGFDPGAYRDRAPWQLGEGIGTATLDVAPSAAWLVERLWGRHGAIEVAADRSARFTTPYASLELLTTWIIGMDGQVVPVGPPELVDETLAALERGREAHEGEPPAIAAPIELVRDADEPGAGRRPSPVAPERFAVLQAMLADLLESCGDEPRGEIGVDLLKQRYGLDDEQLVEQINLLNLVNFGGGCYAVYAEFPEDGGVIKVEKELYGEEFRRPARLSPLEAKAILMALDLVGPQVAAGAGTTLDQVRRKVEAAFGRFALRETPTPVSQRESEGILSVLNDSIRNRRLVKIEYLARSGDDITERTIEPYLLRGVGSDWYVESYDRTADGERTFRVDRIRAATAQPETFRERQGLDILERDRSPRGRSSTVSVWFAPEIALRETEALASASALADGAALVSIAYGSERWLATEILKHRGNAILIAPEAMRTTVVERATALAGLLGARSAGRA
jgi:predicted DNA-binding transcriptional regulator YafY